MSGLRQLIEVLGVIVLVYFALANMIYLFFTPIAWRSLTGHLRAREYSAADETFASPLTPPVSILLPAFNEEAGIVESVRSLLALRYPEFEVIVINDGSSDATLARLMEEFDLAPIRKVIRDSIACAPVFGSYVSRRNSALSVIDKENGGKADALNCGVNAARYPYFCAVDADAIIEEDALLRVAQPILDDPELVAATGGIIRIANGCKIDHGRVTDVRLPRSRLATFQVVEYFRAFLVGRVGWNRLSSLLIISGAFGLFRRSLVEAVGGYWTKTVGEDVELVIRLHHYLRERGEPYRIEFVPDPVCWTEAPEDLRTLARQRRRWQRGLAEALWRHRSLLGNPRYGVLGLAAFPYFLMFELLGALVELLGYLMLPPAVLLDMISPAFLYTFLVLAILLGVLFSISALALEEFSFRRHTHSREVWRMIFYAVAENFGYRQLTSYWRVLAFFDLARRKRDWGAMRRKGLGPAPSIPRPPDASVTDQSMNGHAKSLSERQS